MGEEPKPKNYDALKPIFSGKNTLKKMSALMNILRVMNGMSRVNCSHENDNGVAEEIWVDREDDEPKEVKLLKTADNLITSLSMNMRNIL